MTFKEFMEKAQSTGENLKEEIISELLRSRLIRELVSHDLFSKAVSRVVETRREVAQILKENVRSMLQIMDVPTRTQLMQLQSKVGQLEKIVDRVGKRAILVKSLKTLQHKKAAKRK